MKKEFTPMKVSVIAMTLFFQCTGNNKSADVLTGIDYCVAQAHKTLDQLPDDDVVPRSIEAV